MWLKPWTFALILCPLSALLCIQECIIIKAFWQCGNSKVIISSLPKEWNWDKVISFQKNCGRKFEWEMKKKSFWRRAPSLLFGLFPASCMLLLLSSYIMYPRIYSIERWQLWMTFASTMVARWARLLFSNLAVAMLGSMVDRLDDRRRWRLGRLSNEQCKPLFGSSMPLL